MLAVCAHPDDESFGLGAVLAELAAAGADASVLCFTHGEASTLGTPHTDLAAVRSLELSDAAARLGVGETVLLDYPDGRLSQADIDELAGAVFSMGRRMGAGSLLAFDLGGVTGHPDHHRATEAAILAAGRLAVPVMGWAVPDDVAAALNADFGTAFVGRRLEETAIVLNVDRTVQWRAIECHTSQSSDNPVLHRRLSLQGDREYLVWLRQPSLGTASGAAGPDTTSDPLRRGGPQLSSLG